MWIGGDDVRKRHFFGQLIMRIRVNWINITYFDIICNLPFKYPNIYHMSSAKHKTSFSYTVWIIYFYYGDYLQITVTHTANLLAWYLTLGRYDLKFMRQTFNMILACNVNQLFNKAHNYYKFQWLYSLS